MRKEIFRMWALVGASLLAVPAAWASHVSVLSDPGDDKAAFAAGDMEDALSSRGHTVVKTSSLRQVPSDSAVSIVLTVLDDMEGVSAFQAAGTTRLSVKFAYAELLGHVGRSSAQYQRDVELGLLD